jgi:hypothetical protein
MGGMDKNSNDNTEQGMDYEPVKELFVYAALRVYRVGLMAFILSYEAPK